MELVLGRADFHGAEVGIVAGGGDLDSILSLKGFEGEIAIDVQGLDIGFRCNDLELGRQRLAIAGNRTSHSDRGLGLEVEIADGPGSVVNHHTGHHQIPIAAFADGDGIAAGGQGFPVSSGVGVGGAGAEPGGVTVFDYDLGFQGFLGDRVADIAGEHRAGRHRVGEGKSAVQQPADAVAAALHGVHHEGGIRLQVAGAALDQDLERAVLLIHPVVKSSLAAEVGQGLIGACAVLFDDL